ncbi:MAG: tyrosine-type recombinase/integrase [Desulfovibrionaceae bacterium]
MKLTATAIKNAKPGEKTYRLHDGGGMYLEVIPAGGKYWRLKYRFQGKEKRLALGVFPTVSLADARERRDAAKKSIAQGIDPSEERKAAKAVEVDQATTFATVAGEWHARNAPKWTPRYAGRIMQWLERHAFPFIGGTPCNELTAPAVLRCIRPIEEAGAFETAHRVCQTVSLVMRYAVATGQADSDPTRDLRGALAPKQEKHFSSVTAPHDVAALLRAIDGYKGSRVTRCAMRLAPLVFVRPGELRHMEWSEISLSASDGPEWRIPAAKMKMREQHIVPLSRQVIAILEELHPLTGAGRYVFPSERSAARSMSENTVNAALRRMGYTKEEMTGHGFRSLASTMLHEQGWPSDVIERQLAHAERNKIKAAYNFAEYLPERRRMMQAWADFLDGLREGGNKVVPLFKDAGNR